MSSLSRRQFLAAAATVAVAGTKSSAKVLGANDRVRIAVAGLNGRGGAHVGEWSKMPDVEITYLIDPDTRTYKKRLDQLKNKPRPKTIQDVRQALEDKDLDAISVATPNHWHSLMTIWGCQAGKDVYVEKPASHNIHEGKIAVATARKYNRIVQHGTQSRSSKKWMQLAELAKAGTYGKLLVSRGLVYKDGGTTGQTTRGDLGFKPFKNPPRELDFNIWLGPAKTQPYHENLVHYRWHWFWDFGNGDIGNQGVHQMDIARWMIPGATLPKTVVSFGGRIGFKDQGQTARTQVAVMDYGDTKLIFEVRGLPSKAYPHAGKSDNVLHFEAGTVAGGKFYPKGKGAAEPVAKVDAKVDGGESDHFANFIAAVRSRNVDRLHADILQGHRSAALIHLANASYRLGKHVPFVDGKALGLAGPAEDAVDRMEQHLSEEAKLTLADWPLTVGKVLTVDAEKEMVVDDDAANKLLTAEYRKGFAVPEKV
ncbi:MAG TPA: Gfo/Idh/MocA family oxidoreductase [Fimbriiglobus sp.]|jgi:predicted dehydrogenase